MTTRELALTSSHAPPTRRSAGVSPASSFAVRYSRRKSHRVSPLPGNALAGWISSLLCVRLKLTTNAIARRRSTGTQRRRRLCWSSGPLYELQFMESLQREGGWWRAVSGEHSHASGHCGKKRSAATSNRCRSNRYPEARAVFPEVASPSEGAARAGGASSCSSRNWTTTRRRFPIMNPRRRS